MAEHPAEHDRRRARAAVTLQFQLLIEGEDDDGGYMATDAVPADMQQVISAVIDAFGKTESGIGFDAEILLEGDETPTSVHFEWDSARWATWQYQGQHVES